MNTMFFLIVAAICLVVGLGLPIVEVFSERDWPRATIGKAIPVIGTGLLSLWFALS